MDWHNFKVMGIYAIIVFIFLLILGLLKGQPMIAVFPALCFASFYLLYGLFDVLKSAMYKLKWEAKISDKINQNIKEITICHITKRHPKLKRRKAKQFINDINNKNYTIDKKTLTVISSESTGEADSGLDYYLKFSNDEYLYQVNESMAHRCNAGDVLWVLKTPTDTAYVLKQKNNYINLFFYNII